MNSYRAIKHMTSALDAENLNPPIMWLNAEVPAQCSHLPWLSKNWLTVLDTAPLITSAIIKWLQQCRKFGEALPCFTQFDPWGTQHAVKEQDIICWYQFLLGRIANKCVRCSTTFHQFLAKEEYRSTLGHLTYPKSPGCHVGYVDATQWHQQQLPSSSPHSWSVQNQSSITTSFSPRLWGVS